MTLGTALYNQTTKYTAISVKATIEAEDKDDTQMEINHMYLVSLTKREGK